MDIGTTLKHYNQEHLLEIIENMDQDRQKEIIKEIKNIDFEKIKTLTKQLTEKKEEKDNYEPMQYIDKQQLTKEEIKRYEKKGEEIIKSNKYAVITMAGGQGTRLGHNGPKGTYILNINGIEKTLFEILSENFKKAKLKYNIDIPWYIMTSNINDEQTKEFFKKNNYFGLNKVNFFKQPDIPVIDEDGKLLVGEDYLIKKAGNGNGGIYEALDKQDILTDMETNGIEWIFVSGVDNILIDLVDPLFIGLNYEQKTQIASKSTTKIDVNEKAGVFCKKNGKNSLAEYIEISDEIKREKDIQGKLAYAQINILSHLYNLDALKKLKNDDLPYHIAHKKGNYLDNNLNLIIPEQPNIYKFEKFIFDAFEKFDNMTLFSVQREKEFAPIKNATGNDSPETAIKLYINAKEENV